MTLVERLFHLCSIEPFNRLSETELTRIVEAAIERTYEPGKRVATKDKPPRALFITLKGHLTDGQGHRLPNVLPADALIGGLPLAYDIVASPADGAICLLINKGHFFTILYECPSLAIGFIEQAGVGAGGEGSAS